MSEGEIFSFCVISVWRFNSLYVIPSSRITKADGKMTCIEFERQGVFLLIDIEVSLILFIV